MLVLPAVLDKLYAYSLAIIWIIFFETVATYRLIQNVPKNLRCKKLRGLKPERARIITAVLIICS